MIGTQYNVAETRTEKPQPQSTGKSSGLGFSYGTLIFTSHCLREFLKVRKVKRWWTCHAGDRSHVCMPQCALDSWIHRVVHYTVVSVWSNIPATLMWVKMAGLFSALIFNKLPIYPVHPHCASLCLLSCFTNHCPVLFTHICSMYFCARCRRS